MFPCSVSELRHFKVLLPYFSPAHSGVFTQTVRFGRKPRWLPMAKSKLFRISERPVIPEEDRLELQRLHFNYKTKFRTIRKFLHDEQMRSTLSLENVNSEKSHVEEAVEFERCMQENDAWNAAVAEIRNERLANKATAQEERILHHMATKDKEKQYALEIAEQKVREYKELSKSFISRETLDEAIEQSLNSVVDYNFAIDQQGNIYPGREGELPQDKDAERAVSS